MILDDTLTPGSVVNVDRQMRNGKVHSPWGNAERAGPLSLSLYIYIYIYVYTHTYMCKCVYIYIYIHSHIVTQYTSSHLNSAGYHVFFSCVSRMTSCIVRQQAPSGIGCCGPFGHHVCSDCGLIGGFNECSFFNPTCDQKKWSSGNKFTIFFPGGVETFQTCRFVDSHTFALCRRTGTSRCARVKRGSGSKSRMLRPCLPLGNGKTVGWWMTGHGSFRSL